MEHKVSKIKLSPDQAAQKIRSWCAYQERSQHETRQKLFDYGVTSDDVELLIAELIGENFINEERFAVAFAGGKFRIKHWGKNKIRTELKKHRLSEYCINKGLSAIAPDDYSAVIKKVIEKKTRLLKGQSGTKKFYALLNYLVARGFESDLVRENLSNLHEEI